MKTKSNVQRSIASALLAALILPVALQTGCAGKSLKTKGESVASASASTGGSASPASTSVTTKGIPARPEQLPFSPLTYEPPAPEKFRVALKSGPIAYVVADRELPLVNIMVMVRTGDYLDPDGKEGLAN